MNRIGENFLYYKFISKEAGIEIANKQINKIKQSIKDEKNIDLVINDKAMNFLYKLITSNLDQGGRGVGNVIEKALINPLARYMSNNKITGDAHINIVNIKDNDCISSQLRFIVNQVSGHRY